MKKSIKRCVRVLRARSAGASHARRACEAREKKPIFLASLPVSVSVFSLVPDLFFDCSRLLEYAKIRTVLQSRFRFVHSLYHYQWTKLAVCYAVDPVLLLIGSVNQISDTARPIRSPTQIWVVTRHQYGISALVSQTSFRGETVGGVVKYRLFSQATFASQIEILTAVCILFDRLRDESGHVRKNTLMVLTHLILNDMVKVKGQISEMATCLEDKDNRISDLAKLFFLELSKKVRIEKQNHKNIRNMDCVFLGSLTREAATMQLFFFLLIFAHGDYVRFVYFIL